MRQSDCNTIQYHPTSEADKWKENMPREIIYVHNKQLAVGGFLIEELEEILEFISVADILSSMKLLLFLFCGFPGPLPFKAN